MKRLKIYAEISFLNFLFEKSIKRVEIELEDREYSDHIGMLVKLLESRVILLVNCTEEEFTSLTTENPYYKHLLKKTGECQLEIHFSVDWKEAAFSGDELFLLETVTEVNYQLYNPMICTKINFKRNLQTLFIDRSKYISKYEEMLKFFDQFIDEVVPETRNLVFADNYILINNEVRENIIKWIEKLIKCSDNSIAVVVISKEVKSEKLKEHKNKIDKQLIKRFSAVQIQLVKGDIHNRHILTDHYWVTCGQALGLFVNGKAKYNDQVTLKSKFLPKKDYKSDSGFELYCKIQEEISTEYKKIMRLNTLEPYFCGVCDNTLLKEEM